MRGRGRGSGLRAARACLAPLLLAALLPASPAAGDGIDLEPERAYGDALLLYGKGMDARAPRWRCEPARRVSCGRESCAEGGERAWLALDFVRRTYRRCDRKGCDTYPMAHRVSGMFTTIDLPGRGAFLRAVNDGSEYVEVVGEKSGAALSFGACAPDAGAPAP